MSEYHIPVLLDESVTALMAIGGAQGCYADATFGGGGHSREIISRLGPQGRLIAFDRDEDALKNALDDSRFTLIHNNFRWIHNYAMLLQQDDSDASERPAEPQDGAIFDGILADLGVSSHQFDTAERGFSFRFDAPLDMRMNDQADTDARQIVNTYDQADLERILSLYGEVEGAYKAAKLIVSARALSPIETTTQLNEALRPVLPSYAEHKYLAKVYQALRIEVNDEMRSLEKFLSGAAASLKEGGRLVVITYHSLEDRMVKNFIKAGNIEGRVEQDIYGRTSAPLEAVNRKPILPQEDEIASNTRARSAKLRIAQRVSSLQKDYRV